MKLKKILFTAFIAGFAFSANAQKADSTGTTLNQEDVPEPVMKTFYKEFAAADEAEWEKEGNTYVAAFTVSGEEKEAKINTTGKVEEIKTSTTLEQLPSAVKNKLTKDYAGYEFMDFFRVEKQGKTNYSVNVEKQGKAEELMFDASGKLINSGKNTETKAKSKS